MISYAVLLTLALAVNIGDRRMLALSAIIGAGVFAPVPSAHFYMICSYGEILIGLLALWLNTPASRVIVRISILLTLFHVFGCLFNGYPLISPYHLFVKFFEHAELVVCILMSRPIIKRILGHGCDRL